MKDAIFAAIPIVCALAFGWAFDAWDAERKKRKEAEFLRDFFKDDARNCVRLLRESNAVLCDLANSAGELGRCLCAWDVAARAWMLPGAIEHDEDALERANGALARFREYAEKNNTLTKGKPNEQKTSHPVEV